MLNCEDRLCLGDMLLHPTSSGSVGMAAENANSISRRTQS
jgi:hypothetical protein